MLGLTCIRRLAGNLWIKAALAGCSPGVCVEGLERANKAEHAGGLLEACWRPTADVWWQEDGQEESERV